MTSKREIKPDRFVFLHEKEKVTELLKNIKLLNTDGSDVKPVNTCPDPVNDQVKSLEGVSTKSCSYCQVQFENVDDQRLHYKLDWHRYNLKQSLAGKNAISEDQFDKILEDLEKDEDNEISGSDDDSDDEEDKSLNYVLSRDPKVFINSNDDKIISIYKCLLFDPKLKEFPSEPELLKIIQNSPRRLTWAIMMLGGGHFAGAIFRGKEVLVHKTFHAYTVRAKQGGSQGAADNKSGGSHPKSAGASLRRYNEMSLMQHIQGITELWEEHFKACQLIFYRATSSNKNALFSGKTPVLTRNDERLRTIPFPTKRATFNEVKRVHEVLGKIEILGKVEDIENIFESTEKKVEKSPLRKKIHRSKSREDPVRDLPKIVQDLAKEGLEKDDNCDSLALELQEVTLSTQHLQEFENTAIKKKGKRSKNNKSGTIQKDLDELDLNSSGDEEESVGSELVKLQNELLTAVRSGNNKMLEDLVSSCKNWEDSLKLEDLLNHQFGDSKTTCLHLAAKHGHRSIVWTLLLHGSDPSVRDKLKKVPFMFAAEKETRNVFRKFMGEFPDKYDYKTAQVPPPLSKEAEDEKATKVNEKKKAQRSAKREKEKLQKTEDQKVKNEKEEKDRFLNLSDREKRALAAERRFLNSSDGSVAAIQKQLCFSCAADITGKTPFEYADNKFCSVGCVKKHRLKNQ
eukprot:GFUD01018567.1.p1 GENE.GFUD01018567.1~~GFUD01018567.1.p1  ORF type:complete len:683 (+),score=220.78 GFUD01018567.1:36-2084(+)